MNGSKSRQKLACVLLVDDDDVTNFVNESVIQDAGVAEEIMTAHNGREALEAIQGGVSEDNCPNLIFLDINMPVMNGFEFLEAYQQLEEERRQSIIVIMLTSSLSSVDIETAQESGAADFMSKPLTTDKLEEVVKKYFENRDTVQ